MKIPTDRTTLTLTLVTFGLIPASIAANNGRSFLLFWLLGALAPITLVYAIFMRPKIRCPACHERI